MNAHLFILSNTKRKRFYKTSHWSKLHRFLYDALKDKCGHILEDTCFPFLVWCYRKKISILFFITFICQQKYIIQKKTTIKDPKYIFSFLLKSKKVVLRNHSNAQLNNSSLFLIYSIIFTWSHMWIHLYMLIGHFFFFLLENSALVPEIHPIAKSLVNLHRTSIKIGLQDFSHTCRHVNFLKSM